MKKRLLAIVLAAVMVCALLPTASAADSDFTISNGVLTEYTGPGGDVVIPDGVTSIGDHAFYGCRSLTSVVIPDSVTSIWDGAFLDCTGLTSVTIPEGVTSIGREAFRWCESLTSVTIPNSVITMGEFAFDGCESLTCVTIPGGVKGIENSAFYGCYALTSVTISEGVGSIGDDAFYNCTSLTDVTIPGSVTSIEGFAFGNCASLTDVTIPKRVAYMDDNVFDNCPDLTVYGYAGSAVEYSCKENQVSFIPIGAYPGHGWSGVLAGAGGELAWAITDAGTLTVDPDQLAPEENILVACYNNNGRFTGLKWIDAQHAAAQVDPATPYVKFFWLGGKQNPLAASVTVWDE